MSRGSPSSEFRSPSSPEGPTGSGPEPHQANVVGPFPFRQLPQLSRRQARLAMRLARAEPALRPVFDELTALIGEAPKPDRAEVLWRASGLRRAGAIAQLSWPRLSTRIGLGIEPALAHAIVDHLLGFERLEPEHRLQVTPVEWGVLGFVVARLLDRLADCPGILGPWDLFIDRVGPDPFPTDGLGHLVTLIWPARIGSASGAIRIWVPEALIALALLDQPPLPSDGSGPGTELGRCSEFQSEWRAEAGTVTLPQGLKAEPIAELLPFGGSTVLLSGQPEAPEGPIRLTAHGPSCHWTIPARLEPGSDEPVIRLTGPLELETIPQEATPMPWPAESTSGPSTNPSADVPVTLVVELGRLNLPVSQLADLKAGDVLELHQHPQEPVSLTSGGKLVARGELVQVDSELGVRITNVFV